jgi:hypothetical protein
MNEGRSGCRLAGGARLARRLAGRSARRARPAASGPRAWRRAPLRGWTRASDSGPGWGGGSDLSILHDRAAAAAGTRPSITPACRSGQRHARRTRLRRAGPRPAQRRTRCPWHSEASVDQGRTENTFSSRRSKPAHPWHASAHCARPTCALPGITRPAQPVPPSPGRPERAHESTGHAAPARPARPSCPAPPPPTPPQSRRRTHAVNLLYC